jgi:hypothetical protein
MLVRRFGFFLPLLLVLSSNANNSLPGHLQPLGSQIPPVGNVLTLLEVPSPQEFFDKFVKPGKPVLFKGAATETPAYKLWTDEYLRFGLLISYFVQAFKCDVRVRSSLALQG